MTILVYNNQATWQYQGMNNTVALGDKVSGFYFDKPFIGTVSAYDGGIMIKVAGFDYLGVVRNEIYISAADRAAAGLRVVS